MKEATARIKINKLLEAAAWRFFPEGNAPANIRLEPSVTIKAADLDALGENFEKTTKGFVDFLLLDAKGFPLIVFAPRGPAQEGLLATARDFRAQGARVLLAAPEGAPGVDLPLAPAPHPDLDTITAIQSFYPMAEALSRARGLDPDHPPRLSKVTRTR